MTRPSHHHLSLPDALIKAWYQALRAAAKPTKTLTKAGADPKGLLTHLLHHDGDDVKQLWEAFTTDRSQLPRYLQDPKRQRLAYLLGFHLPNVARNAWLLGQGQTRNPLNPNDLPITIHDLGAGTGAATQAATMVFGKKISSAMLYDQQPLFLESAAQLCSSGLGLETTTLTGGLFGQLPKLHLHDDHLNLMLMSYLHNEISVNQGLIRRFHQSLTKALHGEAPTVLMLAEGGNQNQARSAMELRDELQSSGWQPLYPCPHALECPLLSRPRDWCYSEGRWSPPPAQAFVDKRLKIDRSTFAVAGYIFANPAAQIVAKEVPAVVVGRPTETRSKRPEFRYLLCQQDGLVNKSRTAFPVKPPFKMRGSVYRP